MTRRLNYHEKIVKFEDVLGDKQQEIVQQLLEHLQLVIIEESTPDYTVYSLATVESLET